MECLTLPLVTIISIISSMDVSSLKTGNKLKKASWEEQLQRKINGQGIRHPLPHCKHFPPNNMHYTELANFVL